MTRDKIVDLYRGSDLYLCGGDIRPDDIFKFAALIAAAEREECAKVCNEQGQSRYALQHYAALTYAGATSDCAAAIRSRGQS